MKLIRAHFQNFRLLRRLRLDFSTDGDRKLTVIRAENESGKTTILTGLQWAFYGDNALPDGGSEYRLHPIDWDSSEGKSVPIIVEVEFETTSLRRGQHGTVEVTRRYRAIRSAEETLSGTTWRRVASTVKLFRITDAGDEPIDPPDAQIKEELPFDLRDVFFTDGDRALNFIEATVRAKRERVQKAIRSLLGLGVIKKTQGHVKKAASEVNTAAKSIGADQKLTSVVTRLQEIETDTAALDDDITDANDQIARLDGAVAENQRRLEAALVKGNRDELKRDIERTRRDRKKIESQQQAAGKDHVGLFGSLALSRDLLGPLLAAAFARLDDLHDKGKIPNTTVPVLEERLKVTTCICGESLDDAERDGQRRRDHIQRMIDDSRAADELQSMVTDLYYGSAPLLPERVAHGEHWLSRYSVVAKRRDELDEMAVDYGKRQKALEARLEDVKDAGIQELRHAQRQYIDTRDQFHAKRSRCETRLEGLRGEQRSLTRQRDNLLKQKERGALLLAQLEVTQDVAQVLANAYQRMEKDELSKVSESMNSIFLIMIGSDPEQGAIIKEAAINQDFDIIVYGPNDRRLNPDRDLNGASRRALTMAFVLALTKVSEVEAPNVIDTPLGMMSGYVKRSVLKSAIDESAQLILFLTRSEIADCEEILDRKAGRVMTLTNTAHYPLMLANDPGIHERMVLRCDCGHRMECSQCQRLRDEESAIRQKGETKEP